MKHPSEVNPLYEKHKLNSSHSFEVVAYCQCVGDNLEGAQNRLILSALSKFGKCLL